MLLASSFIIMEYFCIKVAVHYGVGILNTVRNS
jgi:hypothetical protein